MLSVCCLTRSSDANRVGAILSLYRDVADEIVVAVDDRRADTAARLGSVADRVVLFPYEPPGDRPIAWLFGSCNEPWILNVDDDEVPSPRLLDTLPRLARRDDVTHYWIARRWLFPDVTTYLDEPPWAGEYQLRLVLADRRFLQFSDEFHRPVVCHGPMRFVDAPLWHLDTATNPVEARRAKALAYETERRGMRIAGVSHNAGMYVPELRRQPRLVPVPREDRAVIERVLTSSELPSAPAAAVTTATRAEIDAAWPGAPLDPFLYRARVEPPAARATMVAGVQQTIDVAVTNESRTTWGWSEESQPAIRLSYRWERDDEPAVRTPLPCDLRPGERMVVPLHVVPPADPGDHELAIDLVHEFVRWFGLDVRVPVCVRARRRVAVAGDPAEVRAVLDALLDLPEIEPVLVESDEPLPDERFGHPRLPGLRSFLFGPEGSRRDPLLLARTVRLLAPSAAAHAPGAAGEFAGGIAECEAFVVAGADWVEGAAPTRERWRLAATIAAARSLGVPVLCVGSIPRGRGIADHVLEAIVNRLARRVADADLASSLDEIDRRVSAGGSPKPPLAPGRRSAGSARPRQA
jgi:hypothetical protein